MKNNKLTFLTLLAGMLINSACHKCVECTEINSAGGNDYEWPEICGKRKEIDDYRKYMESSVNPQNKVQCTERKTTLF
jgi:hypothetical protein